MRNLTALLLFLISPLANAQTVFDSVIIENTCNLPSVTAGTVPIMDESSNIISSGVTGDELDMLIGVTSPIQTQLNGKQPLITAGTTLQYWRGDKTFQTLNTAVVPESSNLYFTNARAIGSTLTGYVSGPGTITQSDSILQSVQKLNGNISALTTGVSSVFGRTGAVTAQSGDYTTTQVTEGTNLYYTNTRARAALSVSAPLVYNSSTGAFSIPVATSIANGYLSSTDWSTFNSKQAAGNYLTVLTGDATASGPGSSALTLATVNSNTGSYGSASVVPVLTLNAKGLVTAATPAPIQIAESQVTDLVSDLAGKQPVGDYITELTGDISAVGPGSVDAAVLSVGGSNSSQINTATQTVLNAGNLTNAGTDGITVTGGTGAVLGSGTSLAQHVSDSTHNGYLSSTDWSTFNGKQAAGNYLTALTGDATASGPGSSALTLATVNSNVGSFTNGAFTVNAKGLVTAASSGTTGNLTDVGTDGITVTSGTGAVLGSGTSLAQHVSDSTHNGYLSSTDWSTFNSKQAAGNYLTVLTGDATASGPGSSALTLATVNSNVGSFGSASAVGGFTVNAKGLVTAASSTSIQIAESQVTNLVSDLAGKQPTGNYLTALTGDVAASGPGSAASTLATVNSNVGSFTNAAVTVNAKGLVTAASSGTTGNLTDAGTDGITVTGGTGAVLGSGTSFAQHVSDSTHNGYLSSTDWSTFNGKQAAGNYITALTGDATAAGPGSSALTFATVNSNVGSFNTLTVNGKGLVTAASNTSYEVPLTFSTGLTRSTNTVTVNTSQNIATLSNLTTNGFVRTAGGVGTLSSSALVSGDIPNNAADTTGTATNATNIGTTVASSNASFFPTFVASSSTGNQAARMSTGFSVNPSTNAVTATTFIGALTGTASGNTTYTANNHGMIVSGSGNTMTVVAPDASTSKVWKSGGASADPGWANLSAVFTAPTVQKFTSGSGTYTTAAGVLYIRVKMVGGGGGGGGSGTASATAGTAGGNSTFGTTLLVANGGALGDVASPGGAGGTASLGSGPVGLAVSGGGGGAGVGVLASGASLDGGIGGSSCFGGAGKSSSGSNAGGAAATNSGSGGGAPGGAGVNLLTGAGGGAGGCVDAIITSPAATYSYAVGAAGSAGGAGTSGQAGGAGAAGQIIVEEYYQ